MADITGAIARATDKAVNEYGRYTEQQIGKLTRHYREAQKQVLARVREFKGDLGGAERVASVQHFEAIEREIAMEMGVLQRRTQAQLREMMGGAGEHGVRAGEQQLSALLANIKTDLSPSYSLINRDAIEVYTNYALQLTDADTIQALRQIQGRLRLGLIQGDTIGKLTTDIRQMIGAEFRKPNRALTYKAERIARTEMARAYQTGHHAYGKSVDWIIGERYLTNPIGPWPCPECAELDGHEYYFSRGEAAPIPKHPQCRCYSTHIFRQDIFTKEELEQIRQQAGVFAPVRGAVAPPRRGHLPIHGREEGVARIMADAKAAGVNLTQKGAENMFDAIYSYTSMAYEPIRHYQQFGFQAVVDHWSKGIATTARKYANAIEKYLRFAPKFNGKIMRAVPSKALYGEFSKASAVGKTVDMRGLASWTSEADQLWGFSDAATRTNVFFELTQTGRGSSVMHMSHISDEMEVLVSSKAKYRIVKTASRVVKNQNTGKNIEALFVTVEEI